MKASELRIGNLVYSNNYPVTVCAIDEDGEITTTSNYEGTLNGDITPIPLTEEWLLKFGFEQSEEHEPFTIFRDLVDTTYKIALYIWEHNGHYSPMITGCNCELYYVHQLQNLYFALTGEELTIKP